MREREHEEHMHSVFINGDSEGAKLMAKNRK